MEGDNLKIKFDSFVNQNIESVLMHSRNMDSHPVDREALEVWRNQMIENINLNEDFIEKDKLNLIEWTNRFADNLTCISHEEFLAVFDQITDDLVTELEKKKFKTVILCMESFVDKSSIWLCILAWKKIQNFVTHVMSFEDANGYLNENFSTNTCVIYPDDAAYSGDQYASNCKTIYGRITIDKHFILIPYMSEFALEKFSVIKNAWISKYSKTFKPLYAEKENEFRKLQQSSFMHIFCGGYDVYGIPNRHVLYFDHKLADRVSLYTQVIAYSPLIPPNGVNIEDVKIGKGFIVDCVRPLRYGTVEKLLFWDESADKEKPLCPHPVYKYLKYIFNKKQIEDKEILLNFLKKADHMCYNCTQQANYICSGCMNQVFCSKKCQINCKV
jgi:hypothetical protein